MAGVHREYVELCRLCGSQDETDNYVVFESDVLNATGERAGTCSEQQTERNTHIVSVPLLVKGIDLQKTTVYSERLSVSTRIHGSAKA